MKNLFIYICTPNSVLWNLISLFCFYHFSGELLLRFTTLPRQDLSDFYFVISADSIFPLTCFTKSFSSHCVIRIEKVQHWCFMRCLLFFYLVIIHKFILIYTTNERINFTLYINHRDTLVVYPVLQIYSSCVFRFGNSTGRQNRFGYKEIRSFW